MSHSQKSGSFFMNFLVRANYHTVGQNKFINEKGSFISIDITLIASILRIAVSSLLDLLSVWASPNVLFVII